MKQTIINWFSSLSPRNRLIVAVIAILSVIMFLYWFFVRFVGKNMSSSKPFRDTQPPQYNNNNSSTPPSFQDSPQLFATELMTALEYTWAFGFVCGNPDNICYRLNSMMAKGDEYVRQVGKAYSTISQISLSQAIQKNPCECVASCWTCRTTKYPTNKGAIISKLQSMGY